MRGLQKNKFKSILQIINDMFCLDVFTHAWCMHLENLQNKLWELQYFS